MPGCRKLDAASPIRRPLRRVELRRYIRRGMKMPRACNENRRPGAMPTLYWALVIGAMPTLGLLAALSTLF